MNLFISGLCIVLIRIFQFIEAYMSPTRESSFVTSILMIVAVIYFIIQAVNVILLDISGTF